MSTLPSTMRSTRSPPRGCRTSLLLGTSPLDESIPVPSQTSSQKRSPPRRSSILSPGSASGPTPCESPAGPTTGPCGPEAAPASRSAPPGSAEGSETSATSGLPGSVSSASAALQSSLESRLRARTASLGSTLYTLTWKVRATPSGRSISALRASAPRTSDSGSSSSQSGWATASARDWKDTPGMATETEDGRTRLDQLPRQAQLAAWATPHSSSSTGAGTQGREGGANIQTQAQLAGWGTPTVQDSRHGSLSPSEMDRDPRNLHVQVYTAGPARRTASGEMLTGSTAEMESGGQLNPAHPRWLMGLPPEWDAYAGTGTPLSPRRRRK